MISRDLKTYFDDRYKNMSNNNAHVIEVGNTRVVSDCYITVKNLLGIGMLSNRVRICNQGMSKR